MAGALHPLVGPVVYTSQRRRRYTSRLDAPCSVTEPPGRPARTYTRRAGRDLRDRGKTSGSATHVRRAGQPALIAERINVGHELVTQAQILFQDRLGLLAVGPDLVSVCAAVSAEDGQEEAYWNQARVQLRVIVVAATLARASEGSSSGLWAGGAPRGNPPAARVVRPVHHPDAATSSPVGICRLYAFPVGQYPTTTDRPWLCSPGTRRGRRISARLFGSSLRKRVIPAP